MMGCVGGHERVEAVYRSTHLRLWRALLAFTGDDELASDAEAEAFAQVLRRGDAVEDVEAWVWRSSFRIASGLASADLNSTELATADRGMSPESDSTAEFLGLLANLSPQQRACVALRYVGKYTSSEIGELLGTSAGTVRVQLNRAHATLRRSVTEAEHA
jgi:RNA polymerase sigma factor (sigma-70 family)